MPNFQSSAGNDEYRVSLFSCGDADASLIQYRASGTDRWINILIDAGNESDGERIAKALPRNLLGTARLDYAILSHPHEDHLGGFFKLLEEPRVTIENFICLDPCQMLNSSLNEAKKVTLMLENRAFYDKLKQGGFAFCENGERGDELLKKLRKRGVNVMTLAWGPVQNSMLPACLMLAGPTQGVFKQLCLEIAGIRESSATSDDVGKRAIDRSDDDRQIDNICSLVVTFSPRGGDTFLFSGDAPAVVLEDVADRFDLQGCVFKVPHHGSKHNASSPLYSMLKPSCAVICTACSDGDHPAQGVLNALEQYCDVYATLKAEEADGPIVFKNSTKGHPGSGGKLLRHKSRR